MVVQSQSKRMSPKDIKVKSNVRRSIDPDALEQVELLASVKQFGVLQSLLVNHSSELIAGHRRLWAAIAAGLESVPVIVTDRMLSDTEVRLIQLSENIVRSDLGGFEKWIACTEILCANPSWTQQTLAQHLGLSEASISKLLSPSKLSAEWQAALKAGDATISDCYLASRAPASQHAELLAKKLSGATGEEMVKAARKPVAKAHTKVEVRLSRVKLPLPDGAVVAVSASGEVDTAGLLEILDAAREAVKKADKDHLDVKTLAKVMEDRAKAGSK